MLTETDLTTRTFSPIKDHLYSDLEGEGVVLNLRNGKYYGLNGVGASIWEKIQNNATFGEIEAAILSEYDVDPESCRHEVLSFLEQMTEEELIEVRNEQTV